MQQRHKGLAVAELKKGAWCNLSQGVQRLSCGRPEIPTFTQNSLIYSYEHNEVLSGCAHLQLIGYVPEMVPSRVISDSKCYSLAGDSFSVPLCCIMQTACVIQPWAPWHLVNVD